MIDLTVNSSHQRRSSENPNFQNSDSWCRARMLSYRTVRIVNHFSHIWISYNRDEKFGFSSITITASAVFC